MERHYFWHTINGRRYWASNSSDPNRSEPHYESIEAYKAALRNAYGSLKGVKVGEAYGMPKTLNW